MRTLSFLVALSVVTTGGSPSAHHSFSSEFDAKRPVKLEGAIVRVDWVNPHAWIHLEVRRPDGVSENWEIEMGTPNALFRNGVTKNVLAAGSQVVVSGFLAKDGSNKANGRSITFKDGRSLFLAPSGPGAPPLEGAGRK